MPNGLRSVTASGSRACTARSWLAYKTFVAGALIFAGFASSTAQAQNCTPIIGQANIPPFGVVSLDLASAFGGAISGASAIAATINAANLAFLTHSTAFVSAPASPPPDSQGGGVWIRGVGGESTTKSSETIGANVVVPGFPNLSTTASGNCNSTFKQTFGGVQFGTDISRLNIGGWNIHLGTTAGYLGTTGDIKEGAAPNPPGGPFNTQTQAPFVGTYAAATYGGFFIDALLRYNFYETSLDSPSINLFHQKIDGHGISIGGSAGYHWVVPNSNWFIEPSAGIVWSRVKVDPLQLVGAPVIFGLGFPGSAQISDIINTVGRAGVRVGTSFDYGNMILQPFASVNVYHDFSGDWSANYTSCPQCFFVGGNPAQLAASINGTGVGTYGTYSLGVAGQIKDTGWLGYLRVDYTNGNNIEGWTGSGGIRYQFTPEAPRTALITKAPVKAPVTAAAIPVNWTGFYLGGVGGGAFGGHADATFAPVPSPDTTLINPFPGATSSARLAGILGGGEIGYNYQMGPWVLGLEGDFVWTNARSSKACGNLVSGPEGFLPINILFNATCHDDLDWLATVTGRAGYAWGRALYYLKAGAAWTHEEFSVTCNPGPSNIPFPLNVGVPGVAPGQLCATPGGSLNTISASDNRVGWTAGFGAEFALTNNWSVKSETNYFGFGTRGLTLSDGTFVNSKLNFWESKIGVNYRFSSM
jgi:opacity protein-like surface antigen